MMTRLTAAGTPTIFGGPGMSDNDEPISFEEMLEEMAERGTAAITRPGVKGSGVTLGPPVTIPPGGESVEATARRLFGGVTEAARGAGVTLPTPSLIPGVPTSALLWGGGAALAVGLLSKENKLRNGALAGAAVGVLSVVFGGRG